MLKRIAVLLLLLLATVYFIVAITMFDKPKTPVICEGLVVSVEDSLHTGFLKKNDIVQILTKKKCNPTGKKMEDVDLQMIENALAEHPYINKALCYKTPGGKVCIRVEQKYAVIHVLADNGEDYYIDRSGEIMPHSAYCVSLPVATGTITKKYATQYLAGLGRQIVTDPFWNNQIQQVMVKTDGKVELVPRVGEHIIMLGKPVNVMEKLDRMKIFYTEGLNKVGWNKYSAINLEYDNQVICKKKK